jgi:archaellum component FlaC
MTTTSTLTQESLEESLRRFRIETDNSIETFCNEIQDKFMNMEDLIVAAVTKAVRTPTQEINTQSATNDTNSNYSTAQDSNYTTSTLTDKVDNLTEIVLLLTKDLKELKANQERESSKRTRSPFPTPPKTNTPKEDNDSPNKSPPSKQQRSRSDSIKIPPRNPIQNLTEEGAMEET